MRAAAQGGAQTPVAVVLSCLGGSQGDLGVVRALGREGVRVVLVDEGPGAAAWSRYVAERYRVPGFGHDGAVLEVLERVAAPHCGTSAENAAPFHHPHKPVLIPTADPDLDFVTRHRDRLERHFALVSPRAELVRACLDKARFAAWAADHHLPVPRTWRPQGLQAVQAIDQEATFPLILKPVYPPSWTREPVCTMVGGLKALTVGDACALEQAYRRIAAVDPALVVQDFIPGRDDRLYSLHAYLDAQSRPLAWFAGRKLRTYPVDAGIGCLVESVHEPALVDEGLAALQRVGWTGFALMQFKHDPRDGRFKLLEINPRTSSWNLLAAACGVNLPWIACRDAMGLPPLAPPRQRNGLRYLYLENDWRAFLDYRRRGELSTWGWLASMRRVRVCQLLALDDPGPFLHDLSVKTGRAWRALARAVGRPQGTTRART